MNCSCSGDTLVAQTRIIDGLIKRNRRCKVCGASFWTKEVFDRHAETVGRPRNTVYTEAEAAVIRHKISQKKVDVRRKNEDIQRDKEE